MIKTRPYPGPSRVETPFLDQKPGPLSPAFADLGQATWIGLLRTEP